MSSSLEQVSNDSPNIYDNTASNILRIQIIEIMNQILLSFGIDISILLRRLLR